MTSSREPSPSASGVILGPDLPALLARVEAAEGADRELDARLCAHFRLLSPKAERERWAREWSGPIIAKGDRVYLSHAVGRADGLNCDARPLTASLDAALALCERVLTDGYGPHAIDLLELAIDNMCIRGWKPAQPNAPQIARALLIELLRSLIAQGEADTSDGLGTGRGE